MFTDKQTDRQTPLIILPPRKTVYALCVAWEVKLCSLPWVMSGYTALNGTGLTFSRCYLSIVNGALYIASKTNTLLQFGSRTWNGRNWRQLWLVGELCILRLRTMTGSIFRLTVLCMCEGLLFNRSLAFDAFMLCAVGMIVRRTVHWVR